MAKKLIAFFIFILLFLISSQSVNAINLTGDVELTVPTLTCGDPRYPNTASCCVQPSGNFRLEGAGLFGPIANIPLTIINVLMDKLGSINMLMMERMRPSDFTINDGDTDINGAKPFCINSDPEIVNLNGVAQCTCTVPSIAEEYGDKLCSMIENPEELENCRECMGINDGGSGSNDDKIEGIWTGVGCVKTNTSEFISTNIFGLLISIAGMIALLCIIYSAFTLQLSQGNPEKIQKTQEILTSCITGLILIIFSILILRIIGVDLLRIPGLS